MKKLNSYSTIVFDCDGVILDSNKIKTNGFREAAYYYRNKEAAEELVQYHINNGGVSRYTKFKYFINNIVPKYFNTSTKIDNNILLEIYSKSILDGLMKCKIAKDLKNFKQLTTNSRWIVASGGDQQELRNVFKTRNIDYLFDGGIYGSPSTKEEIITNCISEKIFKSHSLYIGDSVLDYKISKQFKMDFIFLSDWTELLNWKSYCISNNIYYLGSISNIVNTKNI